MRAAYHPRSNSRDVLVAMTNRKTVVVIIHRARERIGPLPVVTSDRRLLVTLSPARTGRFKWREREDPCVVS